MFFCPFITHKALQVSGTFISFTNKTNKQGVKKDRNLKWLSVVLECTDKKETYKFGRVHNVPNSIIR